MVTGQGGKIVQQLTQRKAKLANTQTCCRSWPRVTLVFPLKHYEFCPLLIFSHSFNPALSLSAVTLPPISRTYLLCQLFSCIRGPRPTDAPANSMPHTRLIPVTGRLNSPFDPMPPVHFCQPCLCRHVPPIATGKVF